MEKRGVVEPGRTPIEQQGEKAATDRQARTPRERTEALDDDFTKRAADRAAGALQKPE